MRSLQSKDPGTKKGFYFHRLFVFLLFSAAFKAGLLQKRFRVKFPLPLETPGPAIEPLNSEEVIGFRRSIARPQTSKKRVPGGPNRDGVVLSLTKTADVRRKMRGGKTLSLYNRVECHHHGRLVRRLPCSFFCLHGLPDTRCYPSCRTLASPCRGKERNFRKWNVFCN